MAAAPKPQLPLLYKDLVPLNARQHGAWRSRATDKATWLAGQNIVPLTVDEFAPAQRHFPIAFSPGDKPVPLALMGLNEGVNAFVGDDGTMADQIYVPAYARRYPFMLARVSAGHSDLSLCFDPTTDLIGEFPDGQPLFDNDNPTDACKAALTFCEQFEIAGRKTEAFVSEIRKHDLLVDGETTIRPDGEGQPFLFRGFQIVDEARLRELPGEVLAEWSKSGILPLIHLHLVSLQLMSNLFARQARMGEERPADSSRTHARRSVAAG